MKKRKKIGFIAALTAVMFITALLVTTCAEPKSTGSGDYTPPPGKGYIVLKTLNPRTLFPDTLGIATINDLEKFDIIIYNTGTTTLVEQSLGVLPGALTTPIAVPPGNYDVLVLGYKTTAMGSEARVVAVDQDDNVNVALSTGGTATVTLKEVVDGTANGRFTYNVTLPALYDTAEMTFTPLSGQTLVPSLVDLDTTNSGSVDLRSGYWRVTTTLELLGSQTAVYRETVHIYQGLVTSYSPTFPALNNTTYPITFYDWDNNAHFVSTAPALVGVTRSHLGTLNTTGLDATTPTISSAFSEFVGWFTKNGTGNDWGVEWASTTPILRPLSLYARWIDPSALEDLVVTVTVSITNDVANDIALSPVTTNLNTTGELVINITNYAAFTGLTWTFNETTLSNGTGITIDPATSSLTYNFTLNPAANIIGDHTFTVYGTRDSKPFGRSVTVNFTLP